MNSGANQDTLHHQVENEISRQNEVMNRRFHSCRGTPKQMFVPVPSMDTESGLTNNGTRGPIIQRIKNIWGSERSFVFAGINMEVASGDNGGGEYSVLNFYSQSIFLELMQKTRARPALLQKHQNTSLARMLTQLAFPILVHGI